MSSTCVAAIVVLHVIRAAKWSSDTLEDVLALGSKVFKENLKNKSKGQAEIRIADITGKIQFRSFEYRIESQQMFFGKVESTVANICNIEQGLTQFFLAHLAGVIDGPNIVAVWTENNYYYMFDAKARNSSGKKLTKEESVAGETGMSCVTRFQHLKDLAEIYIENVPKKERSDYYKITHIELKPFLGKNWNHWNATLPGQWCLVGETQPKSKESLRACITALFYAECVNTKNWKSQTIDEISTLGSQSNDRFCGESNSKEMKMEIVFQGKSSFVSIKQKMFRYVVNALDKNIEDYLVKGGERERASNQLKGMICRECSILFSGFTMFFEANKRGVFSFNTKKSWKYFSIWKSGSNWFAFGLYKPCSDGKLKNLFGTLSQCLWRIGTFSVASDRKKNVWCALRFTSPIDMVKSLTANITIRKNQEVDYFKFKNKHFCLT